MSEVLIGHGGISIFKIVPSAILPPVHQKYLYKSFISNENLALTLLPLFVSARGQAVQAENVTVLEGGTAQISCRLQNYDGSIVVIQNPRRQTLFFNGTRGERGY